LYESENHPSFDSSGFAGKAANITGAMSASQLAIRDSRCGERVHRLADYEQSLNTIQRRADFMLTKRY
jgi:hypothetical protein